MLVESLPLFLDTLLCSDCTLSLIHNTLPVQAIAARGFLAGRRTIHSVFCSCDNPVGYFAAMPIASYISFRPETLEWVCSNPMIASLRVFRRTVSSGVERRLLRRVMLMQIHGVRLRGMPSENSFAVGVVWRIELGRIWNRLLYAVTCVGSG